MLMLQVLNNENPQSCQTCFRNFARMVSTMSIKTTELLVFFTFSVVWYSREHDVSETRSFYILRWRWGRRHHLRAETDPVSETSCSLEYQTMGKVQNPVISCVYTPSSEPFRIYNVDKTGLLYPATPGGFLSNKHTALSSSKKAMDRVTVLCCSNISGTDKRKLLVTRKRAKPRCF
jgi:hypothetical protein